MDRKPMFVRRVGPLGFQLIPRSRAGWIVSLAYMGAMVGFALLVFRHHRPPAPAMVAIWAVVTIVGASAFAIWGWRSSIRIDPSNPSTNDAADGGEALGEAWFLPHPYGIGATPVTWQGWAVTVGFVVLLLAELHAVHDARPKVVIAFVLVAGLLAIVAMKTKGGLGWHWGAAE